MIKITVIGIERISDDVDDVNVDEVIKKFKGVNKDVIRRPREGKIDFLIGIDYAAYHPTKVVVDHLTLYENRFGKVRGGGGGGYECNKETLDRLEKWYRAHHITASHKENVDLKEFQFIEQLGGVECTPKCGGFRCRHCHPGGKTMTLKEEEEYNLIESNLTYLPDERK